jgi:hypothetical protein
MNLAKSSFCLSITELARFKLPDVLNLVVFVLIDLEGIPT